MKRCDSYVWWRESRIKARVMEIEKSWPYTYLSRYINIHESISTTVPEQMGHCVSSPAAPEPAVTPCTEDTCILHVRGKREPSFMFTLQYITVVKNYMLFTFVFVYIYEQTPLFICIENWDPTFMSSYAMSFLTALKLYYEHILFAVVQTESNLTHARQARYHWCTSSFQKQSPMTS